MNEKFDISVASPPDRKKHVVEVVLDNEHFIEINEESKDLTVEIYPRPSGGPWILTFDELQDALTKGKKALENFHAKGSIFFRDKK